MLSCSHDNSNWQIGLGFHTRKNEGKRIEVLNSSSPHPLPLVYLPFATRRVYATPVCCGHVYLLRGSKSGGERGAGQHIQPNALSLAAEAHTCIAYTPDTCAERHRLCLRSAGRRVSACCLRMHRPRGGFRHTEIRVELPRAWTMHAARPDKKSVQTCAPQGGTGHCVPSASQVCRCGRSGKW
jgi:hypothetical protein